MLYLLKDRPPAPLPTALSLLRRGHLALEETGGNEYLTERELFVSCPRALLPTRTPLQTCTGGQRSVSSSPHRSPEPLFPSVQLGFPPHLHPRLWPKEGQAFIHCSTPQVGNIRPENHIRPTKSFGLALPRH